MVESCYQPVLNLGSKTLFKENGSIGKKKATEDRTVSVTARTSTSDWFKEALETKNKETADKDRKVTLEADGMKWLATTRGVCFALLLVKEFKQGLSGIERIAIRGMKIPPLVIR